MGQREILEILGRAGTVETAELVDQVALVPTSTLAMVAQVVTAVTAATVDLEAAVAVAGTVVQVAAPTMEWLEEAVTVAMVEKADTN